MHYLDWAATTPVLPEAADEMIKVLRGEFGNPSSQYTIGRNAKQIVDSGRKTMASALDCGEDEVFFTSCGTESDNWAIRGAVWNGRHTSRHIITTAVEHSAVLECMKQLEAEGCEVTYLSPDKNGDITAEQVGNALREDTVLVSVMAVNNELGTVYPIAEIAKLMKAKNSRALLHTDAVQAFLKTKDTAKTLGADLISVSGHKIGAPKGIGALYVRRGVKLRPLLPGGGQESGMRSGTEATAQIAGLAKAVELRCGRLDEILAHTQEIHDYAVSSLSQIEGVKLIGNGKAPHIVAFSLVGYPAQNIVNDLDAKEIYISAGSACHRGKPSNVIAALKLPKKESSGAVRISFGPDTENTDVDALCNALREHKASRFPMF